MLIKLRLALIRLIAGKDLSAIINMSFTGNSTITPVRSDRVLYYGIFVDARERTEPLVLG